MGNDMEILKCEKLSKIYGSGPTKVTALDQVDLSVEKGEFVAACISQMQRPRVILLFEKKTKKGCIGGIIN